VQKYTLSKHNDVIKLSKMGLSANNIIVGTMFIEMENELEGFNESTGDKIKLTF